MANNLAIISRYKEDIDPWMSDFHKGKYIVFNKHKGDNLLPNVGRESHTYLHFIIENYNNLPDNMVFLQGDPFNHIDYETEYKNILEIVNKGINIDFINFGFNELYSEVITFEKYFKFLFFSNFGKVVTSDSWDCQYKYNPGSTSYQSADCRIDCEDKLKTLKIYPTHLWTKFGATFAVSKERILNRNLDWYKKAITLVDWHIAPLAGHFFERAWPFVMGEDLPFDMMKLT